MKTLRDIDVVTLVDNWVVENQIFCFYKAAQAIGREIGYSKSHVSRHYWQTSTVDFKHKFIEFDVEHLINFIEENEHLTFRKALELYNLAYRKNKRPLSESVVQQKLGEKKFKKTKAPRARVEADQIVKMVDAWVLKNKTYSLKTACYFLSQELCVSPPYVRQCYVYVSKPTFREKFIEFDFNHFVEFLYSNQHLTLTQICERYSSIYREGKAPLSVGTMRSRLRKKGVSKLRAESKKRAGTKKCSLQRFINENVVDASLLKEEIYYQYRSFCMKENLAYYTLKSFQNFFSNSSVKREFTAFKKVKRLEVLRGQYLGPSMETLRDLFERVNSKLPQEIRFHSFNSFQGYIWRLKNKGEFFGEFLEAHRDTTKFNPYFNRRRANG